MLEAVEADFVAEEREVVLKVRELLSRKEPERRSDRVMVLVELAQLFVQTSGYRKYRVFRLSSWHCVCASRARTFVYRISTGMFAAQPPARPRGRPHVLDRG